MEYLAHLSSGQWDKTLDDLVNLGFVPAELGEDPAKRAIVAPVLAETLEALYSTGGGMDVKVDALQEQVRDRHKFSAIVAKDDNRDESLSLFA